MHGRGGGGQRPSSAAQAQARRRGRSRRASRRCARRAPTGAPHRRCQRGLDAGDAARIRCRRWRGSASHSSSSRSRPARDEALARMAHAVPVAADESCHTSADVAGLVGRYDVVNVKLDKTGGLTRGASARARAARGFSSASWSAAWSAPRSPWRRRLLSWRRARPSSISTARCCSPATAPGLVYEDGRVHPPVRELWG